MKLGYENTDKKIEIEIYGLNFEIKNAEKIKKYEDVEDDDLNTLEKLIEEVIGKGSIEKLNEKRQQDGYNVIDSRVALNIILGIYEAYMNEYTNQIMQPLENSANRINKFNRETRRYNSRRRGNYGRH